MFGTRSARSNKSTSPQYTLAGLWALPSVRLHAPCFRPRRQRMQRRTVIKVPSSPLLVPPTPGIPASQIAPGLDKPVSRLSARTFGLPNRIWLIVGLFKAASCCLRGSYCQHTRPTLPTICGRIPQRSERLGNTWGEPVCVLSDLWGGRRA